MPKKLRVLIVDDSSDDALLLIHKIKKAGWNPIWKRIASAAELKSELADFWDIALVDYAMPGFGGLEALRLIREMNPDMAVILISGTVGEEIAVEAMRTGAGDYILKDRLTRLVPAIEREVRDAKQRSRHRQAVAELQESEERFRSMFEQSAVGMAMVSADGKIQRYNQRFLEMLGYSEEEFREFGFRDITHPEDFERELPFVEEVLRGDRDTYSMEKRYRRKDGTYIWVNLTSSVVRSPERIFKNAFAVVQDISDRKAAENIIRRNLEEKEVLLREIHHRVKNNMQIMTSLLRLQESRIEDPAIRNKFRESQNRIRSMALLHERLYKSGDMSQVDFAGYLERMILHLFSGLAGRKGGISYNLEVKNVQLDINRAIPCGLLINELVSNSLQHAFPPGREGALLVRMKPSGDGRFSLVVGDNGIGLPDSTDPNKAESLGFQLVNDLVRQLDGTLRLDRKGGTTFYINF